jgi:hypothetical protein
VQPWHALKDVTNKNTAAFGILYLLWSDLGLLELSHVNFVGFCVLLLI